MMFPPPSGPTHFLPVKYFDYDWGPVETALSTVLTPAHINSGQWACVKIPCWRANAQIVPLAHFMEVLSFTCKDGIISKNIHTQENTSSPDLAQALGAVTARPNLIHALGRLVSNKQRNATETVTENSVFLLCAAGAIALNPSQKSKLADTMSQELKTNPDTEGRYSTLLVPKPKSAHMAFETPERVKSLLALATLFGHASYKGFDITWQATAPQWP